MPTKRSIFRFIPIATWLSECSPRADIVAGIAVAGLLVPEGMAYAGIAGVPPQMGLHAAMVGMFVYAIFGTSRQPNGLLFFGNANHVRRELREQVKQAGKPLRAVVINLEACPETDVTSLEMLKELRNELHESGTDLCYARVADPVRDLFRRSGFLERLGEGRISRESSWRSMHSSRQTHFRLSRSVCYLHSCDRQCVSAMDRRRSTMETVVDGNRAHNQADPIETSKSQRALEPLETISEIWFGLIMVLTFTCSLSVNKAGREEVRTLLIGALGCNVAWGIIDGVMHLVRRVVGRGTAIAKLSAVRNLADPGAAHRIISDSLPPLLASVLSRADLEVIRQKLSQLPEPPRRSTMTKRDWLGAAAVFLAVFLSTFPVTIPFLFISNVRLAMRLSNGVAVVMLFLTGYAFGVYTDHRPLRMGIWMAIIGCALVGVAAVLGG